MNTQRYLSIVIAWTLLGVGGHIQAQTLPVTHDLMLWLKADAVSGLNSGDSLAQWNDSSGTGNHFANGSTGNQPTYISSGFGGKPIVRFDGTSDFVTNVNFHFLSSLPALTFFFVHKIDTDPPAIVQSGFTRLGQGSLSHYPFTDGVIYDTTGSAVRYTTGDPTFDLTRPHIYAVESTSGLWRNSFNGGAFFTFNGANTVAINDATRPNSIGVSDPSTLTGGNERFFDGDMAEILIYNTELTATERQDVTEYLLAKWSIPEPTSGMLLMAGAFWLWRWRGGR